VYEHQDVVSTRQIQKMLPFLTKLQVEELAGAGGFGPGYRLLNDGNETKKASQLAFPVERVHEMQQWPRIQLDDLEQLLAPSRLAVILRQTRRQEALDDDTRTYYGVDLEVERSPDPEVRKQQDLATGRWWELSRGTQERIEQEISERGFVPLISTVATAVLLTRKIVGIDYALSRRLGAKNFAFVLDAPNESVSRAWLNAGPGKPLKIWRHR